MLNNTPSFAERIAALKGADFADDFSDCMRPSLPPQPGGQTNPGGLPNGRTGNGKCVIAKLLQDFEQGKMNRQVIE
jgi:hypothetical protein